MTNAEKYLKDGVDIKEFARIMLEETTFDPKQEDIIAFLNKPCKPTLTEDERVILRNLRDKYKYIGREGMLYIAEQERNSNFVSQVVIDEYKFGLFQFIKERRRI